MEKPDKKGFDFDPIDLTGILPAKKESVKGDGVSSPAGEVQAVYDGFPIDSEKIDQIIDTLFEKMKKKGDFPTFSRQILEVNKILKLKYSSARDIANVIMRDFSLSKKLLKLVNSSFYGQFSKNGGISSVSSAMIILGADQIQQAAASLILFEHMQANAQNQGLKEIAVSTFMSGLMAKDLAMKNNMSDTEEFQVCGMFYNLGENLIAFYFPEKYQRILAIEQQKGMDRECAAQKILGLNFKELGVGVAKKWGIPGNIIRSMSCDPVKKPPPEGIKHSREDYLGYISAFSNALVRIYQDPDPAKRGLSITRLLGAFNGLVDIDSEGVDSLLNRVSEKIKAHATQLNINIGKSQLIKHMEPAKHMDPAKADAEPKSGQSQAANTLDKNPSEVRKRIYEDIRRIEECLKKDFRISDILVDILNVMSREFDFDRIAICIRDVGKNIIAVRHGLGKDIDAFCRDFQFPIGKTQDIFHLSMVRERDYSIPDINDPKYKALIPSWFRMMNMAKGFDLYALVINHVAIGFFYADRETERTYSSLEEQKNMKKLRNLAEKTIRIKKNNTETMD